MVIPALSTAQIWLLLAAYVAAINLLSFAMFGVDKRRAERRDWRIPERSLLMVALLGGSIGAFLGRAKFRHKTRKQPFVGALYLVAVFHAVMLGAMGYGLITGENILEYLL